MNKVIVLTGSIVGIAYLTELFIAWYSQSWGEMAAFQWRIMGPYWWSYWAMMTCNVVSPQLFWVKKLRRNIPFTFVMSIVVNIGMWFERFVIIVTSTYRDWIPGSWAYYSPTWPEMGFYLGTFGLFFTCYFLFAKYFPVIAVSEIKFVLKTSGDNYKRKQLKYEEQSDADFITMVTSHHDEEHEEVAAHH
jgi:molybdopterin-containing oxidoreductase family membrane subunit